MNWYHFQKRVGLESSFTTPKIRYITSYCHTFVTLAHFTFKKPIQVEYILGFYQIHRKVRIGRQIQWQVYKLMVIYIGHIIGKGVEEGGLNATFY